MQKQRNMRVPETMFCFIVQWLSICDAETVEHEGGRDHVSLHSSVVEHFVAGTAEHEGGRDFVLLHSSLVEHF